MVGGARKQAWQSLHQLAHPLGDRRLSRPAVGALSVASRLGRFDGCTPDGSPCLLQGMTQAPQSLPDAGRALAGANEVRDQQRVGVRRRILTAQLPQQRGLAAARLTGHDEYARLPLPFGVRHHVIQQSLPRAADVAFRPLLDERLHRRGLFGEPVRNLRRVRARLLVDHPEQVTVHALAERLEPHEPLAGGVPERSVLAHR